jgi:F0F1-type ATP synthase beta subunit
MMSEIQGRISQVLGAVVDVEFPEGELPDIYDALRVEREGDADPAHERRIILADEDHLLLQAVVAGILEPPGISWKRRIEPSRRQCVGTGTSQCFPLP